MAGVVSARAAEGLCSLFLELGLAEERHGSRTLLEHLLGTFRLLDEWGNDSEVALAGLCHSVYGTRAYKRPHFSDKERLAKLIGTQAERLVVQYAETPWDEIVCLARAGAILETSRSRHIDLRALAEIHVANLVEQWGELVLLKSAEALAQYISEARALAPLLSSGANEAVRELTVGDATPLR